VEQALFMLAVVVVLNIMVQVLALVVTEAVVLVAIVNQLQVKAVQQILVAVAEEAPN
jgi:hypothetical protein